MMTLSKIKNGRNSYYTPDYLGGVFDSFFNEMNPRNVTKSIPTNISESKTSFHVEMAIPGFNKEDVNIEISKDVLKIEGKKEEKNAEGLKFFQKNFSIQEFKKSYTLPENVSTENIHAGFNNGVLSIEIPKTEPEKPVSIKIDVQ